MFWILVDQSVVVMHDDDIMVFVLEWKYSIDGDDFVDAPVTLEKYEYRLAVSLMSYNDEIELL